MARYGERSSQIAVPEIGEVTDKQRSLRPEIAFFPNLRIACGSFRSGTVDADEVRVVSARREHLDTDRHFIARASGNSMNGGEYPIRDGDYLLMQVVPEKVPEPGAVMAVHRRGEQGDSEYVLREVDRYAPQEAPNLHAFNSEYPDMLAPANSEFVARLVELLDPLELEIGHELMREEIPPLFGSEFNPGNWNSGHVVLEDRNAHVLLVTLNKQGKEESHRYLDRWIDDTTFTWQSQRSTTPQSKRGREIIQHDALGIEIHLFVRPHKLRGKKASPFTYYGRASYRSHTRSAPIDVILDLPDAAGVPK